MFFVNGLLDTAIAKRLTAIIIARIMTMVTPTQLNSFLVPMYF